MLVKFHASSFIKVLARIKEGIINEACFGGGIGPDYLHPNEALPLLAAGTFCSWPEHRQLVFPTVRRHMQIIPYKLFMVIEI